MQTVLAAGIMRGLRIEDTKYMTVGEWVDYIITYNQLMLGEDAPAVERRATQSDFDGFGSLFGS